MPVFKPTAIPEVVLIEADVFEDERGFFMETYEARKFAEAGINLPFVQDNHSGSCAGTLRGLHYQIRHPQGKLIRVVSGEIFDVAVDLRRSSPTFKQWLGMTLSSQNRTQLWVPVGFAHGFLVTSEWAEVIYKTTDFYAPKWERTLLWQDETLNISWPLAEGALPKLSAKDSLGARLEDAETFD